MMFTIPIGVVRGLITLALMLAFIAMVIYVYSKRNKNVYDQAARLPLEDSPLSPQPSAIEKERNHGLQSSQS